MSTTRPRGVIETLLLLNPKIFSHLLFCGSSDIVWPGILERICSKAKRKGRQQLIVFTTRNCFNDLSNTDEEHGCLIAHGNSNSSNFFQRTLRLRDKNQFDRNIGINT